MAAPSISDQFIHAAPPSWPGGVTGGGLISTLNGEALKGSWPQPGTSIGGGWGLCPGTDPLHVGTPYSYMIDASVDSNWIPKTYFDINYSGPPATQKTDERSDFKLLTNRTPGLWTYTFALNTYYIRMVLEYKASRKRTETVTAVLVADLQNQVSENAASEPINLTSDFVASGVDPGGGVPIGSPLYRSYFQTDRGAASFEYLLMVGRAKLRAAARAAEITFATDWRTAMGLTLRNSVALFDRRIPGGSATGKVKHYRLTAGEGGMFGEFTIGCSIGSGASVAAATGVNGYVEDGYVDPGYQIVNGGQYMLLADELAYQTLDHFAVVDDGLDLTHLTADKAVNFCSVENGMTKQMAELLKYQEAVVPITSLSNPLQSISKLKTTITIDLKPVTGAEFHSNFLPAVSMLGMPKTIDLAAPTTGESTWDATHPAGDSTWDDGDSGWDQPDRRGSNDQPNRSYEAGAGQPDNG